MQNIKSVKEFEKSKRPNQHRPAKKEQEPIKSHQQQATSHKPSPSNQNNQLDSVALFKKLGLIDPILRSLAEQGFTIPTEIQTKSIPIVVAGRFYCGWLCPFGALSEFIGRLPFRKWQISRELDERWRKLKYILLGIIIITVLISRHIEYGNYETYIVLFSLHGNILTWTLVILMLIINVRVERFWCRYMCPVGAFTGLLSREDRGYISTKDCPMGNKPDPHISECIRCNRCYSVKGSIT